MRRSGCIPRRRIRLQKPDIASATVTLLAARALPAHVHRLTHHTPGGDGGGGADDGDNDVRELDGEIISVVVDVAL